MTDWTRESVLKWIEDHAHKEIVVRRQSSAFRAQGICKGVADLDACSAHYQECELVSPGVDADITLCFHSDTMSVHLIAYRSQSDEVVLSMPVSIPFSDLILSDPADPDTANDEPEEPAFSPYELL